MSKIYRLFRYDWPLHFVLLLTNWFPDNLKLLQFRGYLARPFFKHAGKNIQIGRNVTFYNPSLISIGSNVYFALGCWFTAANEILIGSNILFGPYCVIVTSNHSLNIDNYFSGKEVDNKSVEFSDGCWIGAHSVILSGSRIGNGCILAANSVLNSDCEDFSVYGGTPAKFLKYAKNE